MECCDHRTNHSPARKCSGVRYTTAMRDALVLLSLGIVAVLLTVLFFMFGGVSSGLSPQMLEQGGAPISFSEVVRGDHSSVTWRANYLITSAAELTELWKLLDRGGNPPDIDFTSEQVIAVFAGKQPVSGYEIQVAAVRDATSRQVEIVSRNPGGSCVVAALPTEPYQIIVVPKSTLPLTRTERVETISCLR